MKSREGILVPAAPRIPNDLRTFSRITIAAASDSIKIFYHIYNCTPSDSSVATNNEIFYIQLTEMKSQ
jgi:hypothetical protein